MTKQETFDLVCTKVIEQGKPAMTEGGNCRYRTEDGLKCAAGHLIPDADWVKIAVGAGGIYGTVTSNHGVRDCLVRDGHDVMLVYDLQRAHDEMARETFEGADFVAGFKKLALTVAAEHELDAKVLG